MVYKPHQQPGTFPKYLGHPSKLPLLKADYCRGNLQGPGHPGVVRYLGNVTGC